VEFQDVKVVKFILDVAQDNINEELFKVPDTLSEKFKYKLLLNSSNLAEIITGQTQSVEVFD